MKPIIKNLLLNENFKPIGNNLTLLHNNYPYYIIQESQFQVDDDIIMYVYGSHPLHLPFTENMMQVFLSDDKRRWNILFNLFHTHGVECFNAIDIYCSNYNEYLRLKELLLNQKFE